jgi:hypothetical protein
VRIAEKQSTERLKARNRKNDILKKEEKRGNED